MNLDNIGLMSCNPAIGGLAKGQIVKEIDALGGEMGKAADQTGIQFRRLNTKKGPAVRSSRAQIDRQKYRLYMKSVLENEVNLDLKQAVVDNLLIENKKVYGVKTHTEEGFLGKTVIITPGTFFNGLIHIGLVNFPAGRMGDFASVSLPRQLRDLGFELGRLKTGTTPRLDGKTIDFSKLEPQYGDEEPVPFSFSTNWKLNNKAKCYITYTNEETHEIIKSGFDRSPLYTGVIVGTGVRYCPSIEDKVVRFPDKERHQVFLEPEGLDTNEYYPNGVPTSLPYDIQIKMLRSIEGLEKVEISIPENMLHIPYLPFHEMPLAYNGGDIFFFPTYAESYGNVLMEAAACGKALVIRDIEIYREWFVHGENCLKGRNVDEFVDAIEEISRNEEMRKRLAENAQSTAQEQDISRTIDEMIKMYYELMEG